jgi:hypothetical protein
MRADRQAQKDILILYHAQCYDGFGAAWAAWKVFGESGDYRPVMHGHPFPPVPVTAYRHMYILDFSYSRPLLEALAHQIQGRVTVLDHHKTAQDELRGLAYAQVDLTKSGALLAWEHFFPGTPPPKLIQYVHDRDLRQFTLPGSRAVAAWLQKWRFDFQEWEHAAHLLEDQADEVVREGMALLQFKMQLVHHICEEVRWHTIGQHTVPVANTSVFFADVTEELLTRFPDTPFTAYYVDRGDGMRHWGLRSRGDFDVSEVAKAFGGGGHQAAAGFREPLPGGNQ